MNGNVWGNLGKGGSTYRLEQIQILIHQFRVEFRRELLTKRQGLQSTFWTLYFVPTVWLWVTHAKEPLMGPWRYLSWWMYRVIGIFTVCMTSVFESLEIWWRQSYQRKHFRYCQHWLDRRSASCRATFSESRSDSAYTDASPFGSSESQFHLKLSIQKCLYWGDSRQPIYINWGITPYQMKSSIASILTYYGNPLVSSPLNWLQPATACKTGNPTFGIQGLWLNDLRRG